MWRKTKREKAELLLAFTLKRKQEVALKHKTLQHTHYLVECSTRCTTLRLWQSVYMYEKMFNAYRKNLPSIRINKRERERVRGREGDIIFLHTILRFKMSSVLFKRHSHSSGKRHGHIIAPMNNKITTC